VLISHTHRFIFMKTKKTAGSSIQRYFAPFCLPPDTDLEVQLKNTNQAIVSPSGIIGQARGKNKENLLWRSHLSAKMIRDLVGDPVWSTYFRFSTIRNPYETAVSSFFFKKYRRGEPVSDLQAERANFQHWLSHNGPPNNQNKYLINNSYCLSDMIRYETLLPDMERICHRLHLPFDPGRLPRLKCGIRPDWATADAMYTPSGRAVIERHCADELNRFGYHFPSDHEAMATL
jgi:hypothetical protein